MKTTITFFSMLLCFGVFAQGPPGGGGGGGGKGGQGQQRGGTPNASEILSKLDTNNDETIDKDEASKDPRGKISEDFDEIDTNDDELIDLEELEAAISNSKKPKKVSPEKLILQIDDNGDGTLNELEIAVKGKRELIDNFSEIDTNEDGELDVEEISVFFEKDVENEKKSKRNKRD